MSLTQQLYDDYVAYWSLTANVCSVRINVGSFVKPPQPTPGRLAALKRMAEYCIKNGADPRLWLYTLFASRQWTYAPKFDCLTPKAHLKRYHKEHRLGPFQLRMAQERQKRVAHEQYDPNRDLAPGVEHLKARFLRLGQPQACMKLMETETLGFHPKSGTCLQCPAKVSCETTLRKRVAFDIIALRRGDITAAQAQQMSNDFYRECMQHNGDPYGQPYR